MSSIRKIKKSLYAKLNIGFRVWEFNIADYFSTEPLPIPNVDVFEKTLDELRANGSLPYYRTVRTVKLHETSIIHAGLRTHKQIASDRLWMTIASGIFMQNNVISALLENPSKTNENDCAIFPPGHPLDQEDKDRHNKIVTDIRIPKEGLFYNGIDVAIDNGKAHFCVY